MREIKFRAWHKDLKEMFYNCLVNGSCWWNEDTHYGGEHDTLMQYTGLKDKNGLTDVYEGDIIGVDGLRKGNQYENTDLLKDQSNLLIQGFGTAAWETTNKKAMERGCKYSQ
jgi:hypothetical protein